MYSWWKHKFNNGVVMKLNELKNEIEIIRTIQPKLKDIVDNHQNIIIIGNGGSNSVASHISQDYTKHCTIKNIH